MTVYVHGTHGIYNVTLKVIVADLFRRGKVWSTAFQHTPAVLVVLLHGSQYPIASEMCQKLYCLYILHYTTLHYCANAAMKNPHVSTCPVLLYAPLPFGNKSYMLVVDFPEIKGTNSSEKQKSGSRNKDHCSNLQKTPTTRWFHRYRRVCL